MSFSSGFSVEYEHSFKRWLCRRWCSQDPFISSLSTGSGW